MRLVKYNRNGYRKTRQEQPVPVGTIISFAGTTAPGGWLSCNGAEVLKTSYPALNSVIQEYFGSYTNGSGGAGTTHIKLPDMQGKVPVGAGTGAGNASSGTGAISGTALTARTLGTSVGNASITLSSTESGIPAHNHSVNQTNHNHSVTDTHTHGIGFQVRNLLASGSAIALPDGFNTLTYNMVNSSTGWSFNGTSTSGITVNTNAGENATSSHSNVQPALVLTYIIKAV
jgi:microcystin-dependent protein